MERDRQARKAFGHERRLYEPRGRKARGPRLLPVRGGGRWRRPLGWHDQGDGERSGLTGWPHDRPVAIDVAVMPEIPRFRKIWRLPQVGRLVSRIWSVPPKCSVPVRIAASHDARSEVPCREGPLQDVIATRSQYRNVTHSFRGVLILIDQARVIDGGGHHRQRLQLERLIQTANGFQNRPRSQAVRSERKTVYSSEMVDQIVSQHAPALDRLIAFDRVVNERHPAGIAGPQDADKETVRAQLQPLLPVRKVADSVRPIYVKAVRAQ